MRQYVGPRCIPDVTGQLHDITQSYENLVVVDNGLGTSYISRKPVPPGIPLTNTEYWGLFGATSGAIINLQNQIDDMNAGRKTYFITPQDYGAAGDGITDDTQAFIDALADTTSMLFIPSGTYKITQSLTVPQSVIVRGSSKRRPIIEFYDCDGFIMDPNWGSSIEYLFIRERDAGGALYPKTHEAIVCNGTGTGSNSVNYGNLRNLTIHGFNVCIQLRYTWSMTIDNVDTQQCNIAIELFGQSVNNKISNCELIVDYNNTTIGDRSGNASILLFKDTGLNFIGEGLVVSNCIIAAGNYGIYSTDFLALEVTNCIIDLAHSRGISYGGSKGSFIDNWVNADDYGIFLANFGAATNCYNRVTNNYVLADDASGRGIHVGYNNNGNIISNNAIESYSYGIYVDSLSHDTIVADNNISFRASTSTSGIYLGDTENKAINNIVKNGTGLIVQNNKPNLTLGNGTRIIDDISYNAKPTSGTFEVGDVVLFKNVFTSGYVGAVCTVAGTPGTWKYFGAIES